MAHLPPREIYRDALIALMQEAPNVFCLDSDTGLFAGANFGAAASRYINLGIAEQNLVGVAAGLAANGKRPFVNTMATFAATRALEQVKVDVAYNALPVCIVGTHAGLSAGHLGPTHHGLEDLATMRILPHMTVLAPADGPQTHECIRAVARLRGPSYVRLGRHATADLPVSMGSDRRFEIGALQLLRRGDDAVAFACGALPVHAAIQAAEELGSEGIGLSVANVHTIKPLDRDAIVALAEGRAVVTIEDHWREGGLGSAVAELLSDVAPTFVQRIGVRDTFSHHVGDHAFLMEQHGVTRGAVIQAVRQALVRKAEKEGPR